MVTELQHAEYRNNKKTMRINMDLIKRSFIHIVFVIYMPKNFLDKYNDIALLADLMGHESIETTRIYLRRTATEQQALIDKIVTW